MRRWLLPVLEDIRASLGGNPSFPQDNARIHTAKLVLSCVEQYVGNLEPHPTYSPDLTPIEHAWVSLRQAHTAYPLIGDYPVRPRGVRRKLAEILLLCWEKIPPKQFEALWRSMPDRVQAVIEAKGWYSRY